jgi:hypothetical protein
MTDNRPTLDVGKFTADKPNLFDVFVGYRFWLNKFGDDPYPPRIAPVPDTHGEQRAMSASPGTSSSAMRARAIPVLLAAVLAGCAQRDSRVASAVGQTFVVFHGLDQACMHRGMVKELADHDWTIRSVLESQIVAQQPAPAWINTVVPLASFVPPQVRMTLTIVPSGSDVKVQIESGAIIHPGAGKEQVEPIQETAQMTAVFNNSMRRLERACGA